MKYEYSLRVLSECLIMFKFRDGEVRSEHGRDLESAIALLRREQEKENEGGDK